MQTHFEAFAGQHLCQCAGQSRYQQQRGLPRWLPLQHQLLCLAWGIAAQVAVSVQQSMKWPAQLLTFCISTSGSTTTVNINTSL